MSEYHRINWCAERDARYSMKNVISLRYNHIRIDVIANALLTQEF